MIGLIKQLDAAVAADPGKNARAFVAFVNEGDEAFRKRLVELAEKEKVTIPLTVSKEKPPKGYVLSSEAYVTAVAYADHKVQESIALREKELDDAAVARIVAAAKKLQQPEAK